MLRTIEMYTNEYKDTTQKEEYYKNINKNRGACKQAERKSSTSTL